MTQYRSPIATSGREKQRQEVRYEEPDILGTLKMIVKDTFLSSEIFLFICYFLAKNSGDQSRTFKHRCELGFFKQGQFISLE